MINLLKNNKIKNKLNIDIIRNISTTSHITTSNTLSSPYWKKLLFTDLHVSSKSLDRTIQVLKKVRETSCLEQINNKPIPVVFLGDFWHQRNILHVRHIDKLLKEFQEWEKCEIETTFIPGNHDQVSIDGSVHGIQMFSLFPNFKVTTDPFIDVENGCAYLPWRETKEEQKKLFTDLSLIKPNESTSIHDKWTVFAHAEIKGAISNGGYKSNGKFQIDDLIDKSINDINNKSTSNIRSCYLGHYHKRQQISNNFWYIGSPYQQNFGEMNDPHGVAFVDSNRIEPYFVDFTDLPTHHKLYFPFDLSKISTIKSNDIVEIKSTKEYMKSQDYINSIDSLPPFIDLKRVMISETTTDKDIKNNNDNGNIGIGNKGESGSEIINKFKLEDFLKVYINDKIKQDNSENNKNESIKKELNYLGKEILSMVKEQTIVPMGRKVAIEKINITNFCGLGGNLELNLTDEHMINKMVMIRGEMGSGKSTIFEALVWCLYGNTSPKKQSTSSSSIKGDEVINDQAKQTTVSVQLKIDDSKTIEITRTKKRTTGAKITISGLDEQSIKQGVLDQQHLINNIIGLDYDSFRMSIYLGQGSISNFVTDTDKRRKELLSRIFSLGLCISANKIAKEHRKKKELELSEIQRKISNLQSSLATWNSIDYLNQSTEWNEKKLNNISKLNSTLDKEIEQYNQLNSKLSQISVGDMNQETINSIYKSIKLLENEKDTLLRNSTRNLISLNEKSSDNKLKIKKLQFEIDNIKKSIVHLNLHLVENKCIQCGQFINKDTDGKDSKELLKNQISLENEKLVQLSNQLTQCNENDLQLVDEISNYKSNFEKMKKEISNKLSEKQLELQELNKSQQEFTNIKMNLGYLNDSIIDKQNQLSILKSSIDPHFEKIMEKENKTTKLSQEITACQESLSVIKHELFKYQFWEDGFNSNGLPMMALQSVVKQVESYANEFLSTLSKGKLFTTLSIENQDELTIEIFEMVNNKLLPRSLYQLSGGQRRCLELSYSPFALSEVIYNHSGSRVTFMAIDELTNHLDTSVKPIICDLIRNLQEKDTIIVIDHDISVQSEFDQVFNLEKSINNNLNVLKLIQ